uniref:Ig-like domain-containing protein n=1 Tax=Cyprinus carpio TaxID=7962 RepID=A0A8C1LJU5_CYPCA
LKTEKHIPKPTLTVRPQSSLFPGDYVTLRCEVDQSWDGGEFLWSKNSNTESTEAATKTICSVKVSDGGEYRCSSLSDVTLMVKESLAGSTAGIKMVQAVFSVNYRNTHSVLLLSLTGKYFCYGVERGGSRRSQHSDAVTLKVSGEFDHLFKHTLFTCH